MKLASDPSLSSPGKKPTLCTYVRRSSQAAGYFIVQMPIALHSGPPPFQEIDSPSSPLELEYMTDSTLQQTYFLKGIFLIRAFHACRLIGYQAFSSSKEIRKQIFSVNGLAVMPFTSPYMYRLPTPL